MEHQDFLATQPPMETTKSLNERKWKYNGKVRLMSLSQGGSDTSSTYRNTPLGKAIRERVSQEYTEYQKGVRICWCGNTMTSTNYEPWKNGQEWSTECTMCHYVIQRPGMWYLYCHACWRKGDKSQICGQCCNEHFDDQGRPKYTWRWSSFSPDDWQGSAASSSSSRPTRPSRALFVAAAAKRQRTETRENAYPWWPKYHR